MMSAHQIFTAFLLIDAIATLLLWVFSPSFREWVQRMFDGDE